MDIFTDINSGYKFCMITGNETSDHIEQHGIFEHSLIKYCQKFLGPDDTFLDIGAHMGTYAVILSKFCKQVHAFECQPDTYICLTKSVEANNISNIVTHNVALGSENGTGILYQTSPDGGGSSLIPGVIVEQSIIARHDVTVRTLDSYNLTGITFFKMDVEGSELKVLQGARQTLINNNFPKFIFEAWPEDWYKVEREKLFKYIIELGYKINKITTGTGYDNMFLAHK